MPRVNQAQRMQINADYLKTAQRQAEGDRPASRPYQQGHAYALCQLDMPLYFREKQARVALPPDPRQHYQQQLDERFDHLKKMLTQYGHKLDTGHKRILIPRNALTVQNIRDLGFKPVKLAIPETGQSTSRSWRHPQHNYHLHEHGREWTLHRDKHRASTMMGYKKIKTPSGKVDLVPSGGPLTTAYNTLKGLPHLITEGIPGLYYHLRQSLSKGPDIEDQLKTKLKPAYFDTVKPLKPVRLQRTRALPAELQAPKRATPD